MSKLRQVYTCERPRPWKRFLVIECAGNYRTCVHEAGSLKNAQLFVSALYKNGGAFIHDTATNEVH